MVPSFPFNCALFYKACPIIRSLSSKINTLAAILMLRHFKDEVPLSQEPTRARHSSNLPHDDNYKNNTSLQVLTLPLGRTMWMLLEQVTQSEVEDLDEVVFS
jgi:hypothetical protein